MRVPQVRYDGGARASEYISKMSSSKTDDGYFLKSLTPSMLAFPESRLPFLRDRPRRLGDLGCGSIAKSK